MENYKLYADELLEHYKYPKNNIILENPDIFSGNINPSCGDLISITIKLNNKIISSIGFTGKGCVISQATASILTEYILNKNIEFVQNLTHADIINLIGINLGPTRLKCALLSLEAIISGIKNFKK